MSVVEEEGARRFAYRVAMLDFAQKARELATAAARVHQAALTCGDGPEDATVLSLVEMIKELLGATCVRSQGVRALFLAVVKMSAPPRRRRRPAAQD